MNIPVYSAEKKDGLLENIRASASIAYDTILKPEDQFDLKKIQKQIASFDHPEFALKLDEQNWDLFPVNSLLVSCGWNNNDDVFDPAETWAARHSPVHKQFNFMHDETDIIGHMFASIPIDKDQNIIPENIDVLPEEFDIVVASVLYRQWEDTALQTRMDDIIEGIANDKWFVSMECLFRNFDYAMITQDNEFQVVSRNHSTAFLTKHLRIYGGSGEFEGNKIGRFLRNFTFSGKGLVDNPANPKSIIFNSKNPIRLKGSILTSTIANMETTNMSDNNQVLDQIRKDLDNERANSKDLKARLDEASSKAQEEAKARFQKEIDGLKDENHSLTESVGKKDDEIKEHAKAIEATDKVKSDLEDKISKSDEAIDQLKTEKLKADRIALMLEAGTDSDSAKALVEKWIGVNDEQFADVVALTKSALHDAEEDAKRKKKEKEAKANISDETDENDGDAEAADLEDAEIDADANLSGANASNPDDSLKKSAAKWMKTFLVTAQTN